MSICSQRRAQCYAEHSYKKGQTVFYKCLETLKRHQVEFGDTENTSSAISRTPWHLVPTPWSFQATMKATAHPRLSPPLLDLHRSKMQLHIPS